MDELVQEGGYLTTFIPATEKAFVFRVKSITNAGRKIFNYGPLPLNANESIPTYDGGTATIPADGVLPARAYTASGKSFPLENVYDENDMWYLPEENRDRLFHVKQFITPAFLRVDVQIPKEVIQGRFQETRLIIGIDKDFGFNRGEIESVHYPELHYGYRWGNDTNIPLRTTTKFVYGEYVIEIPKDCETVYAILQRKIPSYWLTMPIANYDASIRDAFNRAYGFEGFPVIPNKDEAISAYRELMKKSKV